MADRSTATRRHGMILRSSSTKSKSISWVILPAEVRLMILDAIVRQKSRGWASLASVCREWQNFIEKRNFYRLKLQVSCLNKLERLVIRYRELVRHIEFDIELRRYTCRSCEWQESHSWTSSNNAVIRDGIWKLFSILSTWKSAHGLVLELNAHSPSDSEHWFKDFYFTTDKEANGETETSLGEVGNMNSRWHDPKHGWINGQRVGHPPELAILRLFETISLSFPKELPQVDEVRCLIIRRQLRRWIRPQTLQLVWNKLCGLEHLIYEPWRPWEMWWREVVDQEFLRLVKRHLPKTLTRLSIFEDFNDGLAAALANPQVLGIVQVETTRVVDPRIGAAFAFRSLDLEELSVAYMVNAEDFFQAVRQSWTWKHLECLALTSQLLHDQGSRLEIDALLSKAGTAALRMPRLRNLVLWNGTKGNACAFIYHTDKTFAYLSWRGTWDLELCPRVVKLWRNVASKLRSTELRIDKQNIQYSIRSHGDAVHHLNLPCQVVDPMSLWQIRREGVIQRGTA